MTRWALLLALLSGCASSQAVQVSDPSQSTDTGLEVASLAIQGCEFVIAHILSHEEAKSRVGVLLPDGGILVLEVVSATAAPTSPAPSDAGLPGASN